MKIKLGIISAFSALFFAAPCLQAKSFPSPDGKFAIETDSGIDVLDSSGNPVMLLTRSLAGSKRVEVSWSPDSRRAVIVTRAERGSAVLAAWYDGSGWHKTIETDQMPELKRLIAQNGPLVAEQRAPGSWQAPHLVEITGALLFKNGKSVHYSYLLSFSTMSVSLDRGGFEKGMIHGMQYRID
jgi:hypothetical protein